MTENAAPKNSVFCTHSDSANLCQLTASYVLVTRQGTFPVCSEHFNLLLMTKVRGIQGILEIETNRDVTPDYLLYN